MTYLLIALHLVLEAVSHRVVVVIGGVSEPAVLVKTDGAVCRLLGDRQLGLWTTRDCIVAKHPGATHGSGSIRSLREGVVQGKGSSYRKQMTSAAL